MEWWKVKLFWNTIWKLKSQPKVRISAWKLSHKFLPTYINPDTMGCRVSEECMLRDYKSETAVHVMLYCWWAISFVQHMTLHYSFMDFEFTHSVIGYGCTIWFMVLMTLRLYSVSALRGRQRMQWPRAHQGTNLKGPFV